jgi:hypothetical protein
MRALPLRFSFFFLAACTPDTDLQDQQNANASKETTSGELSGSAASASAGVLVEPSPGSAMVPTNLARLVVRFAEEVQAAGSAAPFVLQGSDGSQLSMVLGDAVPCAGKCYQVVPGAALAASTLHTLELLPSALQFLDGKPVPGGNVGTLTTGAGADTFAPRIQAFTAQIAEGCVAIHLAADEVARVQVVVGAGDTKVALPASGVASTFDIVGRPSGLPTSQRADVVATVIDLAGNTSTSSPVGLDLPPALPPIVITEVLANPAGPKATQEWVEIYNAGSDPVALGGMVLAGKGGSDVLAAECLAPGAFALVVSQKYDPTSALDTPPKEGTLLLRVSGRLAGDGLSDTGEPIRLLSAGGYVVSQYGGWVNVSAKAWSGESVKRASLDACDAPDAWSKSPSPATPGW